MIHFDSHIDSHGGELAGTEVYVTEHMPTDRICGGLCWASADAPIRIHTSRARDWGSLDMSSHHGTESFAATSG